MLIERKSRVPSQQVAGASNIGSAPGTLNMIRGFTHHYTYNYSLIHIHTNTIIQQSLTQPFIPTKSKIQKGKIRKREREKKKDKNK